MDKHSPQIVVVGAGSAGLMAALTLERLPCPLRISVVHSRNVPVIGVGESTTASLPQYLHGPLQIDRREFYAGVQPSWKLGIRFLWGSRHSPYFYYPFDSRLDAVQNGLDRPDAHFCLHDVQDNTPFTCLMERGKAPLYNHQGQLVVNQGIGYHLDNAAYLKFLEQVARRRGIDFVEGEISDVHLDENGFVSELRLTDDRRLSADLFVDCSGFRSLLLGKTLKVDYRRYDDSLFCDSAIVGSYSRSGTILPYTTAETMDHGWCWQIELPQRVTRGYVFSSRFCSEAAAAAELVARNPLLAEADLRTLRFPVGRYEKFWHKNVVAIGNASGFLEPLEATALHLASEQLRLLCQGLVECESAVKDAGVFPNIQNRRFRESWDDVRDFLTLHYKFNHHSDSEFWKHCRTATPLGRAGQVVELFQQKLVRPC